MLRVHVMWLLVMMVLLLLLLLVLMELVLWLRRYQHVTGERHIGGTARFQRYRVLAEVFEHLGDRGKPKMLHSTLAEIVQRHAQVFRLALEVERQHELALARFALAHEEHAVTRGTVAQDQLGRLGAR
uniref:Putative secreted peptide n=1 Tax=Anopheles braziliensis TaxID=58242 RepID=A0A2M3ZTC0_9DIPT